MRGAGVCMALFCCSHFPLFFRTARLKGEERMLLPRRKGGGVEDASNPLIK